MFKEPPMQVIFINGGRLNDLGPFEAGARISIPDHWAPQLLADGVVKPAPIPGVDGEPLRFNFSMSEDRKNA